MTNPPSALLQVRELQLWRGERHVLHGVSFALQAGGALQVTWGNGAGKTSLLRALAGLLHFERGEVLWRGRPIGADRRAYHAEVAFLGHELALKPDLTADENLRFVAGLQRRCSRTARLESLARVGLASMADEAARHLSAGQQRRAALARLRLQGATLWLLDEPAAHLDAQGQQLVAELVDEQLRAGGLAIIATHQPLALSPGSFSSLSPPGRQPGTRTVA